MLGTEDLRVGVVIEKAESLSPRDEHGKLRLQKKSDDGSQGLGPGFRGSERRLRPIVSAHQFACPAAARQEIEGRMQCARWQAEFHVDSSPLLEPLSAQ